VEALQAVQQPDPPEVAVRVGVLVGPVGVLVFVGVREGVEDGPDAVWVGPLTAVHNAGTLGGSQPVSEV
jgi:hypothetical protein